MNNFNWMRPLSLFLIGPAAFAAELRQPASDLFRSIRSNDTAATLMQLRSGVDANSTDGKGTPALMQAALHSNVDTMKALIRHGADVNRANQAGATALMWSIHDLKKTKLLVENGADVNAKSKEGRTALMIAARHSGSLETVRYLLKNGARPGEQDALGGTAVHLAAESGQTDVIRELARHGAEIDVQASPIYGTPRFGSAAPPGPPPPKEFGITPLYVAAANARTETVRYLVENGANPDRKTFMGGTPLLVAVRSGDIESVRLFLQKGASVDAREFRGATALILATIDDACKAEMVRLLLDNGADPAAKDRTGHTAYDWAAMRGRKDLMEMLEAKVSQ